MCPLSRIFLSISALFDTETRFKCSLIMYFSTEIGNDNMILLLLITHKSLSIKNDRLYISGRKEEESWPSLIIIATVSAHRILCK